MRKKNNSNRRDIKNISTKKKQKIKLQKKSFFIYGVKPVFEFLEQKPELISNVFISQEKKLEDKELLKIKKKSKKYNFNTLSVDNGFIKKNIGEGVNHQGIFMEIKSFEYASFDDWKEETQKKKKDLVLILDKIEDTHNFGAIIRTAAAFNVSAIFIGIHNQAPVNGTVFKTSAGNILKTKIIQIPNINDIIKKIKKENFWVYGLDMSQDDGDSILNQKFDKKTALVLGSEGLGISKKTLEYCDFVTSIPMSKGVESLNVSVTGAIALYEWKRQYDSK